MGLKKDEVKKLEREFEREQERLIDLKLKEFGIAEQNFHNVKL